MTDQVPTPNQSAEVQRLLAVAQQLRSALIDQHELASHWLDGACEHCLAASDEGDGELACDNYKRWQKSYLDALAMSVEAGEQA